MKPLLSIQYLRAAASIAVVVAHAAPGALLGQAGVDLFFAISGFIMWTVTSRPTRPQEFLWHRLVRVAPLYWIATVLMALHQQAPADAVVKSMLFIPFIGEGGQIWPVLVAGWTLNYEMFFYALVGATLSMARARGLLIISAALCSLGLLHAFMPSDNPALQTYTNPLILEFLAGIALAELRLRGRLPPAGAALPLFIAGLAGYWLMPLHDPTETWRFVYWGLPSSLILAAALSLEETGRVWRIRPLLALGNASFAIYLFHPFILRTVLAACSGLPHWAGVLVVVACCSALGLAVFYAVERPMTLWLRDHTARSRVPRPS